MLIMNNGVPKSGSTWVQKILRQGLKPAFPSERWANSWKNPSVDRDRIIDYVNSGEWTDQPTLLKTHFVYDDSLAGLLRDDVSIIVSYRNLADSVVSMFHHQVRVGNVQSDDPAAWYAEKGLKFAKRSIRHKQSWVDKPGVLMVRYEDMLADTQAVIRQVLTAAGATPSDAQCLAISKATRRDDTSIKEGAHVRTAGRSVAKEELPADLYARLQDMQAQMDAAPETV